MQAGNTHIYIHIYTVRVTVSAYKIFSSENSDCNIEVEIWANHIMKKMLLDGGHFVDVRLREVDFPSAQRCFQANQSAGVLLESLKTKAGVTSPYLHFLFNRIAERS